MSSDSIFSNFSNFQSFPVKSFGALHMSCLGGHLVHSICKVNPCPCHIPSSMCPRRSPVQSQTCRILCLNACVNVCAFHVSMSHYFESDFPYITSCFASILTQYKHTFTELIPASKNTLLYHILKLTTHGIIISLI